MAKAFSVASWNIEHFQNDPDKVERVLDFLRDETPGASYPDIFAFYEVTGKELFDTITSRIPGYVFFQTEGIELQEIMVAVKPSLVPFFSQRMEFKAGNPYQRHGALLTVNVDGKRYTLLFLHAPSGDNPKGFGLRCAVLDSAFELRKALVKFSKSVGGDGTISYMFLGDLNTMGVNIIYGDDITGPDEVERLKKMASGRGMKLLTKDRPNTFYNGSGSSLPASNLDHVVATGNMTFKQFSGADMTVLGWPQIEDDVPAQDDWIARYSDHGIMYFEVQKG